MCNRNTKLVAVGCVFAAIAGSLDPLNAVLFADVLNIFTLVDEDEQRRRAAFYGLLFFGLGVVAVISHTTQVRQLLVEE